MTQEYAKIWNLDYKPNMEYWNGIEKQRDEKLEKEEKETGVAKIGDITLVGALEHYIRRLTYDTSLTALERRDVRKFCKFIIVHINKCEKELRNL